MGRWEPNAPERLERAALELFVEQGYDTATVAQIAQRAGLSSSTFFRHFADKREVLSWGQDALVRTFAEAVTEAPPSRSPLQVLAGALDAVGAAVFTWDRHHFAQQRQTVVSTSTELQERQLLKRATLAATVAAAFRARGLVEPSATLVADLGVLAFVTAQARWADQANRQDFPHLAREALLELREVAVSLQ